MLRASGLLRTSAAIKAIPWMTSPSRRILLRRIFFRSQGQRDRESEWYRVAFAALPPEREAGLFFLERTSFRTVSIGGYLRVQEGF